MAVSAHPAGYSTQAVYSGLRSLRAGIDGTADTASYSAGFQDVVTPAGTTDATLSFWWYPISAEGALAAAAVASVEPAPELVQAVVNGTLPEGTLAGDLQYVVLADQSGNVLQTMIWTRSNAQVWQWASYPVSKSLIGRTVRVLFGVYNDGNGRSSVMYVDDVALTTCKPATPAPTATATPSSTLTQTLTPTVTVTPSPTATYRDPDGDVNAHAHRNGNRHVNADGDVDTIPYRDAIQHAHGHRPAAGADRARAGHIARCAAANGGDG